MNRNEYRRALIMLRSLKPGISGYMRLERRTLMGTLQFTINGAIDEGEMHAILLRRNKGGFSGVRLGEFAAPRYGQTGLIWKFDPRNIEKHTLEQYDLAAVIRIQSGICEMLLCGNLNGSVEADWTQVREAACRLFSPVRISGAPIAPIDERTLCSCDEDQPQILPECREDISVYPGNEELTQVQNSEEIEQGPAIEHSPDDRDELTERNAEGARADSCTNAAQGNSSAEQNTIYSAERIDLDRPAGEYEEDEFDTPAHDAAFLTAARAALSADVRVQLTEDPSVESDELDTPAQDDFSSESTAGEQLSLSDPSAVWPDAIEPLREMFFSSEAVVPFETDGYVFIRAALPGDGEVNSCLIGLRCEEGIPDRICYAIPAVYTHEPPAGLEGYVWCGDRTRGYWVISESVSENNFDI